MARAREHGTAAFATLAIPAALDGLVELSRLRWDSPRPHRHRELEFNLVAAGRARLVVGKRRYELEPGTFVWLFAAQGHILLEQSDDFAMWVAVFRPRLVEAAAVGEASALRELDPVGSFCRHLARGPAGELAGLLRAVRESASDPALHNAGLAWLLLRAWRLYALGSEPDAAELHPGVARALRRLETDPATPLHALAREAGLSPGRLGRVFKREVGASVAAHRARARVEAALARLRGNPRASLLDAALAAGFGSYTQFHRVFSAAMGCSPRAWRARARSE